MNDEIQRDEMQRTDACTPDTGMGEADLCCCYVIDENGNYVDPCYRPASEYLDRRCKLSPNRLKTTKNQE